MSKNKLDSRAIAEAYEVLTLLDNENLEKIPEYVLDAFKEKRDTNYIIDIQKLMDGEMLQDTKNILCAMYYRYLAAAEERKIIDDYKKSLKDELDKAEQDIQIGMSEDCFGINRSKAIETDNNTNNNEQNLTEQNLLPQIKSNENIFTKILNSLKSIFKKNK